MSDSPEEDDSSRDHEGEHSPEVVQDESAEDTAPSIQTLYERSPSKGPSTGPEVMRALAVAGVGLAILLAVVLYLPGRQSSPRRVAVHKIYADVGKPPESRGGDVPGETARRRPQEENHDGGGAATAKIPDWPKGRGGTGGQKRREGAEYEVVTSDNDAAGAAGKPAPSAERGVPSEREKRDNISAEVAKLPPVAIGPAPLICVTGTHARLPLLPADGTCDFAVFSDVIFGDNEWVAASSRSKLDAYLLDAQKSSATTFLLSFPSKMRHELVPFLSSTAATDLIRSYAARGIRGYGFARAEVPIEIHHKLIADYSTVLKLLRHALKAAVPSSGISFVGLLLRSAKESKGAASPFPMDIARNVDLLVAISHTPVLPPEDCKVEPSSSWTHGHINDGSLPSLTNTLDMLRDGRNASATLAMSLTLGVLDYRVSADGLAGIDGIWNVACEGSELQPFGKTCSNPLTHGTVGAEDHVVYDFSKTSMTWRSFETADSIMAKVRKCVQIMRSSGFQKFGWALYDVDLEDHGANCSAKGSGGPSVNRLVLTKQLLSGTAATPVP